VKIYLLSLGAGLLAGILYGVLNVRSPAPPVVALVGLLGILGTGAAAGSPVAGAEGTAGLVAA
jgi:XapX domain-containing protein